jgi:nucleoside-triphosphatase THEP1|nr:MULTISPECIES: DUF2478 domain-containing protein [unclassified Bradyrhizobium]
MPDIITITALIYSDSDAADRALRDVATTLIERGLRLAGLVQHNTARPGRSRCDMVLEELASSELIGISQDRGPLARGCALDVGQLLSAMQIVRAALDTGPDLVILNKFGKTEAEGAGFRPLIADAIEAGLPLLIAVPWRNIESWRLFAGALAREIDLDQLTADGHSLCDALGLGLGSEEGKELAVQPLLAISTHH